MELEGKLLKKVSMQDIATELGISKMTVSKCFKNSEDISDETKSIILKKAQEMGYVYRRKVKYHVAALFSEVFFEPNEEFYSGLYKKLQELEWENDMKFSLYYVSREAEQRCELNPGVDKNDAIMLLGEFTKKYVSSIINRRYPTVCLDFRHRGMEADSVVSDGFQSSFELTSYLIDMGHEKIAFVGNLNYTHSVNDRYFGYRKGLLEEGIEYRKDYRINDRDDNGILSYFALPKDMPTAFVCNNDHTAYLLIEQLKKEGYQVPEEVSVVGFDDVIYSELSNPAITSVHVRRGFMAEQAIMLIKRRLTNPTSSYRTITIDCSMKYRDSVARMNIMNRSLK